MVKVKLPPKKFVLIELKLPKSLNLIFLFMPDEFFGKVT
jgi:hypothetical protein